MMLAVMVKNVQQLFILKTYFSPDTDRKCNRYPCISVACRMLMSPTEYAFNLLSFAVNRFQVNFFLDETDN
jgi:hypothetical protein